MVFPPLLIRVWKGTDPRRSKKVKVLTRRRCFNTDKCPVELGEQYC